MRRLVELNGWIVVAGAGGISCREFGCLGSDRVAVGSARLGPGSLASVPTARTTWVMPEWPRWWIHAEIRSRSDDRQRHLADLVALPIRRRGGRLTSVLP